jgi:hypothetical protein
MKQSPSWEVVTQLVMKFPAFLGTRRFITVFTGARYPSALSSQFTPSHPVSLRSISILFSHLRLGLKQNVKLSLCFNYAPRHESVLGEWRHISTHCDLDTRWMWVVSFTPRPLYPLGKSPWYPLDRRLGGPQSRSGRGGEEKNSQPPPGIEP